MVSVNVDLNKEIKDTYKYLGFSTLDEFVKDAIEKRILEIKKNTFYRLAVEIRNAMENKNITETELLDNFERFRHED